MKGRLLIPILLAVAPITFASARDDTSVAPGVTIVDRGARLRNHPCAECHGLISRPENREEAAHADVIVHHGELNRNCRNCHDADDVGVLRLLGGGGNVPFEGSHRLCSQCHGNVLKDWESGVHGAQTGFWNGEKRRRTCTACHDPHEPAFKAMKPLPPPKRSGRNS